MGAAVHMLMQNCSSKKYYDDNDSDPNILWILLFIAITILLIVYLYNKQINMEKETVHGFSIPLRELTEQEASMDITLERFSNYHTAVGEDFADQHGSLINHLIVGGYLMAKHPELSNELLAVMNNKYGEVLSFTEVYAEHLNDENNDLFYTELAEFLNLTVAAKKRVNQILIQIAEHYKR